MLPYSDPPNLYFKPRGRIRRRRLEPPNAGREAAAAVDRTSGGGGGGGGSGGEGFVAGVPGKSCFDLAPV